MLTFWYCILFVMAGAVSFVLLSPLLAVVGIPGVKLAWVFREKPAMHKLGLFVAMLPELCVTALACALSIYVTEMISTSQQGLHPEGLWVTAFLASVTPPWVIWLSTIRMFRHSVFEPRLQGYCTIRYAAWFAPFIFILLRTTRTDWLFWRF